MAWHRAETNSGGFGPGVPPLPIPNREVKPGRADGTAPQCGRVGRRLLDGALHIILWRAPFFVPAFCVPLHPEGGCKGEGEGEDAGACPEGRVSLARVAGTCS